MGDPGQLLPFGLHAGRERTGRLDYMRPTLRDLQALRDHGALATDGPDLALTHAAPFEVYLAAHGQKMLEFTARHANGWIPTSLVSAYDLTCRVVRGQSRTVVHLRWPAGTPQGTR